MINYVKKEYCFLIENLLNVLTIHYQTNYSTTTKKKHIKALSKSLNVNQIL